MGAPLARAENNRPPPPAPFLPPRHKANVALMPTKTIACLRVSTDKQADRGVSLDAQRAKLKAYAELRLVRSTAARRSARLGITGQGARVDRTPRYRTCARLCSAP